MGRQRRRARRAATAARSVRGWRKTSRPTSRPCPAGRGDERQAVGERIGRPRVPVGAGPAVALEQDDGQLGLHDQAHGVADRPDHVGGLPGQVEAGAHGGGEGVRAVDDEGEPERQATCPAGEVERQVGRVDVVVAEGVEVRRRLAVGAGRSGRVGGTAGRRSRAGRTATCAGRRRASRPARCRRTGRRARGGTAPRRRTRRRRGATRRPRRTRRRRRRGRRRRRCWWPRRWRRRRTPVGPSRVCGDAPSPVSRSRSSPGPRRRRGRAGRPRCAPTSGRTGRRRSPGGPDGGVLAAPLVAGDGEGAEVAGRAAAARSSRPRAGGRPASDAQPVEGGVLGGDRRTGLLPALAGERPRADDGVEQRRRRRRRRRDVGEEALVVEGDVVRQQDVVDEPQRVVDAEAGGA